MDRARLIIGGSVAAMLAVILLGWFLGVQPQLTAAEASEAQRQAVAISNAGQQTMLDQLVIDSAKQADFEAKLAVLQKSVPSQAALPAFLDAVNAAAVATGVTMVSFQPSSPVPYVPGSTNGAAEPAAVPAAGTEAAGSTPTPSPTAPAALPAGGGDTTATAPAVATGVIDSTNLVVIPIVVSVTGGPAQVLDFVKLMQTGERLFLINTIVGGSSDAAGPQTYNVGGYIYVAIDPTAAAPAQADVAADTAAAAAPAAG